MARKITVILSSIREGRRGQLVVDWFLPIVRADSRFDATLADLKDYDMPLNMSFREPSEYKDKDKDYPEADRRKWSKVIDESEAYIFITPEYNHGVPASLKNAIDQIYWEWLDKPVGFVGYGSRGASDAIDSLSHTIKALKWRKVEPVVGIEKVKIAFDESGKLIDYQQYQETANKMLDGLADSLDQNAK